MASYHGLLNPMAEISSRLNFRIEVLSLYFGFTYTLMLKTVMWRTGHLRAISPQNKSLHLDIIPKQLLRLWRMKRAKQSDFGGELNLEASDFYGESSMAELKLIQSPLEF